MKKIIILLGIVLSVSCLSAQTFTTFFTGLDRDNMFIPLDKVIITNVTQRWQDTLIYPDTIYIMETVGIDDHENNLSFTLSQNVPNPFAGTSDFTLQMPAAEKVHIDVIDINGRKIATYNNKLPAGTHTLRVQLTTPQAYILNAHCGKNHASIKMLNTANAGINRIQYLSEIQDPSAVQMKSFKSQSKHVCNIGDEMTFIGYATVNGVEYQSETVRAKLQTETNKIILQFPLPLDGQPCSSSATITDYDGNIYNTVQIGNQCWMKENLKTTHYSDGVPLGDIQNILDIRGAKYYYPNDNSITLNTYGLLYNWNAVMYNYSSNDSDPGLVQGICPTGWHIPSTTEWKELTNYVCSQNKYHCGNNSNYVAKALASTTSWDISYIDCAVGNNPNENNKTGFSAVPAGLKNLSSNNSFGNTAYFWSCSEVQTTPVEAYGYAIIGSFANLVNPVPSPKYTGFSVRCLSNKDLQITSKLPSVTTKTPSNITSTTALCGGIVTSDGNAETITYGVYWSTSKKISSRNRHTVDSTKTKHFDCTLTNLQPNTTYYVQAYAKCKEGTAFGQQEVFTTTKDLNCTNSTITDYDGNKYNVIQIGYQCWMKENLRTTHYSDGTAIPFGDTLSYNEAYRYYPNNDSSLVNTCGYSYNWTAVMHLNSSDSLNAVHDICPEGWHVPSTSDWEELSNYVGSQSANQCGEQPSNIAKSLASTTGWLYSSNNCAVGNNPSCNNSTGLSFYPSMMEDGNSHDGTTSALWGSTKLHDDLACGYAINYWNPYALIFYNYFNSAHPVRCLRDEE